MSSRTRGRLPSRCRARAPGIGGCPTRCSREISSRRSSRAISSHAWSGGSGPFAPHADDLRSGGGPQMPTPASRRKLLPSVLDRLLGDDGAWSVESAKLAVKRDLEWLLNSRRVVAGLPAGPRPLGKSTGAYGLPDLATFRGGSAGDQEHLRLTIQESIRRFEPRLSRVRVTLDSGPASDRAIRFRIDALLRVEPEPEPVAFGSVLRLDDQSFEVRDLTP